MPGLVLRIPPRATRYVNSSGRVSNTLWMDRQPGARFVRATASIIRWAAIGEKRLPKGSRGAFRSCVQPPILQNHNTFTLESGTIEAGCWTREAKRIATGGGAGRC